MFDFAIYYWHSHILSMLNFVDKFTINLVNKYNIR